MDYLLSMFRGYMRDYGVDCTVNGSALTRVFLKEIKENQSQDTKHLFAYNGEMAQGDLIEIDGVKWLVLQEDKSYHKQYTRFVVIQANSNINFVINEALYSTQGIIDAGNQSKDSSRISVIDGKIVITIQANTFTSKIRTNDRIIKFGQAWKIIAKTNENTNLYNVFCESDIIMSGDDLINEIPVGVAQWGITFNSPLTEVSLNATTQLNAIVTKNGVVVSDGFNLLWDSSDESFATVSSGVVFGVSVGQATITATIENTTKSAEINVDVVNTEVIEYRITPTDRDIYAVMDEYTFFVNKYINGQVAPDSFTITASGVTTAYYKLQIVDGNTFKLTSLKYSSVPLMIKCVSNTDGYTIEESFGLWVY